MSGIGGQFIDPSTVVIHFHLREGDRVADFGAGSGSYLAALSRAVGASGRVYACEIQKGLVEKLGTLIREKHLMNVEPLWCDLEAPQGTHLADGILDGGLLSNTLFQLENRQAAITEIARVVRLGGKAFVIDWSDSFGGMGPAPSAVVHEDEARSLFEAHGFTFERSLPAGEHHYGFVMRKTA